MEIKINIQNCYQCPFVKHISGYVFSGDYCKKIEYGKIPAFGIRKDCPFKKVLKEKEE